MGKVSDSYCSVIFYLDFTKNVYNTRKGVHSRWGAEEIRANIMTKWKQGKAALLEVAWSFLLEDQKQKHADGSNDSRGF